MGMALFIEIRKIQENDSSAEFAFGTSADREGRFSFQKTNGEAVLLRECPGDEARRLFARAAHKVKEHWKGGALPEQTCWAS
jgi:hypothetical protein